MVVAAPKRGEVFLVNLDPTIGHEIGKTRPCVIVSPDELNAHLHTVIIAPMTTGGHGYPFRVKCQFQRKSGHVVLDQLRTVDVRRLVRRLGALSGATRARIGATLQEMFGLRVRKRPNNRMEQSGARDRVDCVVKDSVFKPMQGR